MRLWYAFPASLTGPLWVWHTKDKAWNRIVVHVGANEERGTRELDDMLKPMVSEVEIGHQRREPKARSGERWVFCV